MLLNACLKANWDLDTSKLCQTYEFGEEEIGLSRDYEWQLDQINIILFL